MELLRFEIKKIFNPITIALLGMICASFFIINGYFSIIDFTDDRSINDGGYILRSGTSVEYTTCLDWAAKYGETIDDGELEQIKAQRESLADDITSLFCNIPEEIVNGLDDNLKRIAANGVTYGTKDYETLSYFVSDHINGLFRSGSLSDEVDRFLSDYSKKENEIKFIDSFISKYELIKNDYLISSGRYSCYSSAADKRLQALNKSDIRFGYLPQCLIYTTNEYFSGMDKSIIVGILILLSPLFVRDKLHKMLPTQLSSKTGRRIYKTKMTAAVVTGALFTVFYIALYYAGLLSVDGIKAFLSFRLPSVMIDYQPWFDMTFGTYLFLNALLTLLISVTVSLVTAWVSMNSKNYIDLLIKVFIEYFVLTYTVTLDIPFYPENFQSTLTGLPLSEVIYTLLLLGAVISVCIFSVRSRAKKDLIEG